VLGYRAGPEPDGSFVVTVRAGPHEFPPRLAASSELSYIAGGHFLLGDRLNTRERHYVWTTAFFAAPFEFSNAEYREFLRDPTGYRDDANWTAAGRTWRSANPCHATALLRPGDSDYARFGEPDQPVVNVTWFEANACCRWLTRKLGAGRWIFSLPTDAEWEKAGRGPDNFDYGLGMTISDAEVPLYNWKKNPGVPVTVVGTGSSRSSYTANRYGLYHMSGNVAEWTQSLYRPYSRDLPYTDDDRNQDESTERRTARGGSWYSATTAPLYIPYRDAFQPDHAGNDLGFRVVARLP
jgi:iron(II)-dependent oxidoreductase